MPAPDVTTRQLYLLDYLLRNLRAAPSTQIAGIDRECYFLMGYVFALEVPEQQRGQLTALIKNAAHHAQVGSPWPSHGKGVTR